MPRENFDTFPQAMLTMFTVSTGEGWTDLLYNAMRIEPRTTPAFFVVFFIVWTVFFFVWSVFFFKLALKKKT